jgi:hypothetical protein
MLILGLCGLPPVSAVQAIAQSAMGDRWRVSKVVEFPAFVDFTPPSACCLGHFAWLGVSFHALSVIRGSLPQAA